MDYMNHEYNDIEVLIKISQDEIDLFQSIEELAYQKRVGGCADDEYHFYPWQRREYGTLFFIGDCVNMDQAIDIIRKFDKANGTNYIQGNVISTKVVLKAKCFITF